MKKHNYMKNINMTYIIDNYVSYVKNKYKNSILQNNFEKELLEIKNINMPFQDKFQNNFEKELLEIYYNYNKNFDKSIISVIKDIYMNYSVIKKDFFPLIQYVIKDNKVYIKNNKNVRKYYNHNKAERDTRYLDNFNIITKTLKWCKDNNLPVPNTTLYIWISDRFPWYAQDLDKFPIWVYARPKNIKLPIFPDNTFECFQLHQKYKGKCYDWESIKKIIKKECKNRNKQSIIYFKGTPTTKNIYKLREDLEKHQKSFNIPIKILLDAWTTYEPLYKFCEYLYLLNLPGKYPWSNRLKYLFLMDSIVININVNTINIKPEYKDLSYITLIDYIVNNKDYIEIIYNYYRLAGKYIDNKNLTNKIDKLRKNEFNKFVKTLKRKYLNLVNNPEKYKKIAKKAKIKVNKLTNERIYQYIYKGILLNSLFI